MALQNLRCMQALLLTIRPQIISHLLLWEFKAVEVVVDLGVVLRLTILTMELIYPRFLQVVQGKEMLIQ